MNIFQQDKRPWRGRKVDVEYLDARIVPAALVSAPAVAIDVANTDGHSQKSVENAITDKSEIQVRRELHSLRIEERREAILKRQEAAFERREMRAARLAALSAFLRESTSAANQHPVILAATTSPVQGVTTALGTSGAGQSTTGSSPSAPGTASSSGSPVGGSTSPTPPAMSGSSAGSQNPLPANVGVLLDAEYEEYENGTLPASTAQPGQVEIQGSDVGVEIETSNSSDFDALVADAVSLGLQVTDSSAQYNIVVGFLPISALPAVAQLPGSPSIEPLLYPGTQ